MSTTERSFDSIRSRSSGQTAHLENLKFCHELLHGSSFDGSINQNLHCRSKIYPPENNDCDVSPKIDWCGQRLRRKWYDGEEVGRRRNNIRSSAASRMMMIDDVCFLFFLLVVCLCCGGVILLLLLIILFIQQVLYDINSSNNINIGGWR